jgi:hypothetical protein
MEETLPFSRHELRQFGARAMFSVIFEVNPKQEKFDLYLDLAKGLKPILEGIVQIPTKSPADSDMTSPGFRDDVAWLAGALLAVDFWQSCGLVVNPLGSILSVGV